MCKKGFIITNRSNLEYFSFSTNGRVSLTNIKIFMRSIIAQPARNTKYQILYQGNNFSACSQCKFTLLNRDLSSTGMALPLQKKGAAAILFALVTSSLFSFQILTKYKYRYEFLSHDRDVHLTLDHGAGGEENEQFKSLNGGESNTSDTKPLNILLLYADDWSFKTLGAITPFVKTPNIDRMAKNGVLFTHNCVTTSICMVSRATLYTGQYASRHKTYHIWKNNTGNLKKK